MEFFKLRDLKKNKLLKVLANSWFFVRQSEIHPMGDFSLDSTAIKIGTEWNNYSSNFHIFFKSDDKYLKNEKKFNIRISRYKAWKNYPNFISFYHFYKLTLNAYFTPLSSIRLINVFNSTTGTRSSANRANPSLQRNQPKRRKFDEQYL